MLVLNRKVGERLLIGSNVVVTVLEVRGNTVKLGCDAPLEVPVHREEIARRLSQPDFSPRDDESRFFVECA